MVRYTTGKSQSKPRYKPPAQTNQKLNPLYAKILKIATKKGWPEYYKRDLVIDRQSISRQHPTAVIWGIRDTGTELICLSRGMKKSAPKGAVLFSGSPRDSWLKNCVDKIEFWSRTGASSPIEWYYITASQARKVSKTEALDIVKRYAGKWTSY